MTVVNLAVCLRRRTEDTEATEIEIEEIRRRIDAAQGAVKFEIVALVTLDETAGENNLEYVTTKAVGYATAYVLTVLIVCQRTCRLACRTEGVCGIVTVVDSSQDSADIALTVVADHLQEHHLVAEIVEDDEVAIHDVQEVGGVVLGVTALTDIDALGISHGVERGVAIDTAVFGVFALNLEALEESIDGLLQVCGIRNRTALGSAVGEDGCLHATVYCYAGNRVKTYERTAVLIAMVVAALHQGTLRKEVADL